MSQSDFIKYKKVYTELKINKLPRILSSHESTMYKQFTLENMIDSSNNTLEYNRIIPTNKKIIFDIETNSLDATFSSFLCNRRF